MFPLGDLTIVFPTYNEAPNIFPLFKSLKTHLPPGTKTHLIFVDDSPNSDTVEAIWAADKAMSFPSLLVNVFHRPSHQRNGLAGAVILGIQQATTKYVCVSDADGQHPADTIPAMLAAIKLSGVHVVVASRYCEGGSADGLSGSVRHVVSRLSTWVARAMFPHALRGVTDPMTGFFLFERQSIDLDALAQAAGFKILLELLVQHPQLERTQVPLQFAAREGGVSKGTVSQGWLYLSQLVRLRFSASPVPLPSEE